MLDIVHIPSDTFQFFVATSVINARFGTLLAAVHVLTLTLLTAFAMSNRVRVQWFALARYLLISLGLLLLIVAGSRFFLSTTIKDSYNKDKLIASMPLSRPRLAAKVYTTPPPPLPLVPGKSRLEQIWDRNVLRICYPQDNNMPFSYLNTKGNLVGSDIELLMMLGEDFNVRIEFVPTSSANHSGDFARGYCDMGTGQPLTPELSLVQDYSHTYISYTLGFLAKDYRRHEFNDLEHLRREHLLIAVNSSPYYDRLLHHLLPKADLLTVDSYETFFEHYSDRADALATLAERAAAWSLLFPEFTIATPFGNRIKIPVAFPYPRGESSMGDFLKNWIELKKNDGSVQEMYDYWILGKQTEDKKPRWCIIRDVLHWVKEK
jgi:ABC-type amino acid transport substrate-binding protein